MAGFSAIIMVIVLMNLKRRGKNMDNLGVSIGIGDDESNNKVLLTIHEMGVASTTIAMSPARAKLFGLMLCKLGETIQDEEMSAKEEG